MAENIGSFINKDPTAAKNTANILATLTILVVNRIMIKIRAKIRTNSG